MSGHLGQTSHVRQLDVPDYPWADLMALFVEHGFDGWILLEAHGDVKPDEVAGKLRQQCALFQTYLAQAVQTAAD